MHQSILFLLSLALIVTVSSTPPSWKKATSYVKNDLSVLDDKFSMGFYEIEFDQDLWVPIGVGYCGNLTCPEPDGCPPCDYTDQSVCNGTRANGPCPCPGAVGCEKLVSGEIPILKLDEPDQDLGPPNLIVFHATRTDPCSGILITWDNIVGASDLLITYRIIDTQDVSGSTSAFPVALSQTRGSFFICPNSPMMGHTIVFSVVDYAKAFPWAGRRVSIRAETYNLPAPRDPSCLVPSEFATTHGCIPSGVETRTDATGDGARFYIQVDKRCGYMQFVSSQFNTLVSKNPWVSPQNQTGAFLTPSWSQQASYDWTGEPAIFSYCLEAGEELFVWVDLTADWQFWIDTSEEWAIRRPLTKITGPDFGRFTLGAITLQCPEKDFTAMKYYPNYLEPFDSGSINLNMIIPTEKPNPFSYYPYFENYEWRNALNLSMVGEAVPKKVTIAVTLSQNLAKRLQPAFPIYFPHDMQFLTESDFYLCNLTFNGLIRNAQNESILTTISSSSFEPKNQTCDYQEFRMIQAQKDQIVTRFRELYATPNIDLGEILTLRFTIDSLSSMDEHYFCESRVNDYVVLEATTKVLMSDHCLADFGTLQFYEDPCCFSNDNKYLACGPESRDYHSYSIAEFTAEVDSSCPTSECARDAITRFINEKENIKQRCSVVPPYTIWKKNGGRVYWKCMTQVFGFNAGTPTPCFHDDDCPDLQLCNSQKKYCMGNVTELEQQFLTCLLKNVSAFVMSYFVRELQLPSFNNTNFDENFGVWWDALQATNLCHTEAGDLPGGQDASILGFVPIPGQSCDYCHSVVENSITLFPVTLLSSNFGSQLTHWDCFGRSNPCITGPADLPAEATCFGGMICNYDTSVSIFETTDLCTKVGQFCGISENLRDAFDLSTIPSLNASFPLTDCVGSTLCILANGTKVRANDSSECKSLNSCDFHPNFTQAECSQAGQCSDTTDPVYSIFSGTIFGSQTGGCISKLGYKPPWVNTTELCVHPLRSTVLGCMSFPPLVDEISCSDPNYLFGFPSTYIEKGTGRWIARATNQQECESLKVCRDVPRQSDDESHYADLVVGMTEKECQGIGGNFGNLWTWTPASWRGGQPRSPKILEYGANSVYVTSLNATHGLNLDLLLDLLSKATNQELALEIGAALFCQHNLKGYILNEISCSCSNQSPEDVCFKQSNATGIETNLVVVCAGRASHFTSPPLTVSLREDSLPQESLCSPVTIANLPISKYAPQPSTLLTLLLIQSSFDYSYSISNPAGQIFGKLLTDGFALTELPFPLSNPIICISKSRPFDPILPIIDLALLSDDRFTPQLLNVTENNETYCVTLPELGERESYFFIQRVDGDWENPPRLDFTSGEVAYLAIILALYVIGLIVVTLLLIRHIIVNFVLDRVLFIILVMESFFLCRTILFSLALSDSVSIQQAPAVGYLLVELPIILFFCFVSCFVVTWGIIFWSRKDVSLTKKQFIKHLNVVTFLFIAIIFGLFILMIILFQTVVDPPYFICGGTQVVFDSDAARALSLSYRIIFSSVAIVLGLALLFTGAAMLFLTTEIELNLQRRTIIQVFLATVIGVFGLLAQAIYYLVVVSVGNAQSIYLTLSILLVDELIPALVFTSLVWITNADGRGLSRFIRKTMTNFSDTPDSDRKTSTIN